MDAYKKAKFRYYGLALFEIEIIYDTLGGLFEVSEEQLSTENNGYISIVEIEFPVPFGEFFFQFFTMERWHKIKGIIKEMKRRRGKKGIKVYLGFYGISPEIKSHLIFLIINGNNRQFEMGIEKIEYLVDIIPIHLKTLPANIEEVTYYYDETDYKWNPRSAKGENGLNYSFKNS